MARESQEQRLARYRHKIESSRQWREDKGYIDTWRRMIDLYRGKQVDATDEGDQAMVNLSFSVLNVVVSAVTTQYPKFTVNPNVMGQDDQATIAEAVLNYAWKHYNFHDEFQASVVDTCMMGHGWLKIGWRYRERVETVTLSPEEQMAQVEEAQATADSIAQAAATDPQAAAIAPQLPSDEEIEESVKGTQQVPVVHEDDPFVERVSPFDIVVDPEAVSIRELRWIAQRVIRDVKEIRDDQAYDARARRKVTADMTTSDSPDDSYQEHEAGDTEYEDDDRATVWEFYDLATDEWCVFAEQGEGFLVKPDKIPNVAHPNPFVMFRDYEVPDTFYPMGEIESVEALQEELNKTRTQQINARKQYIRKFIGREAALGPKAREALASEIDGDVAFVTDDDRPLNDLIVQAPSLSFDPQLFIAHSSQVIQDLQMVTGLSDYQFGQMPDTRRLATEAMAVEGATNARSSFKLARIERTLALVGRVLLCTMQQFMDAERVARVSGPGGEMLFQYGPDDIKGEYDLNVEAGSTQPKNDMIRRQEAVTLFNTLAPYMGLLIDPHELIRYLLQQGYDIKNVDRFFVQQAPAPPGMAAPGMAPPGQLPPGEAGAGGSAAPGSAPTEGEGSTNGQVPLPVGV